MSPATPTDLAIRHIPVARDTGSSITVIEPLDRRLIDTAQIERMGQQIVEIINSAPSPRVVMDFVKVEYLSSTMLNALIAIDKSIKKKGGMLRLANLAPELHKMFTIMRLNKVITICDSLDEALTALKS